VVVPNARLPTNEFGEAFLVWRCLDCGTTGSLDALPGSCPGCGTGRESLYYYTED
jgi:rubrerythrin